MRLVGLTLLGSLTLTTSCRDPGSTEGSAKTGKPKSANSGDSRNPSMGKPTTQMPDDMDYPKNDDSSGKPPKESETPDSDKPIVDAPDSGNKPLPAFCETVKAPGDWKSTKAFFNAAGKLEYPADEEKNRIVDFSYAGYHYGEVEPPTYAVAATIGPVAGDNTKNIQDAIDALGKKSPDAKGVRGALLLKPGLYSISGSLKVPYSGMVLRGSGRGDDPRKDTIILATGDTPHQRTVVTLGVGSGGAWKSSGTPVEVSDAFVQVGSLSFNVKDAKAFKVGDTIQIKHPSTKAWIDALGGGGMVAEPAWEANSTDIIYNRRIESINGTLVTLDAPIYNHLDKKLATATVSKATVPAGIVKESGIENIFVDVKTAGGEDENHAWDAIAVAGAEDSWVRNITAKHYGQAGVMTTMATRITVDEAYTSDGVGVRTGGRFYNFNAYSFSQLILFKNCHGKDGRHNFISNGVQTTSGVVWYKCTSEGDSASEGHRRWSQAMLFDSIKEGAEGAINLVNRGDAGTSHGWGSAHSVVWNYSGQSTVQKPPTAQNYFISPVGKKGPQKVLGPGPTGFVEIKSGKLSPSSLYEAQLCERLKR